MVIVITIIILFFISISSYQFFINNSNKVNDIARQNIKENAELLIKELGTSLKNKMEVIRSNIQIISNSPSIKTNLISALSLLETAQNSTSDLTAFYGWTNKTGNIQWSTLFSQDKELYDKLLGTDVSSQEHFEKVRSTLELYITPVIPSLLNISTIFISYPILLTDTKEEENFNTTTIEDAFQIYSLGNLFDIVKEQQKKSSKNKEFGGTIYAGIDLTSMVKLLETQVLPKSRSSISLIDRDGTTIYSANKGLDNIILDSQEKKKNVIEKEFDQENQQLIYQMKDRILSSSSLKEGEIKSIDIQDKSGNLSSTISYLPISVNDQVVFYLMLDTQYEFAKEIDDLLLQQRNFIFGAGALIGIIAFIISIIMIVFNNKLKKIVEEKTKDLKIAVNSLEKANEQLKQHDNMQKEFINIAAHELRTPIQTIIGYCEMISVIPKNSEKYLESIRRNAERLSTLIEDILDVTRIESNKLKIEKTKFDLNEKMNNVIKDLVVKDKTDRKQDIEFNSPFKDQIMVYADKIRIYQVISNLLRNALKFTPNGKITITLEKTERNNKKFISVRIKDDGKGIDPQVLPMLFKKFVTKSESGTGLGLYISKNIVEAHGGIIRGYNNPDGKGATFEFTLPLDENRNL